MKILIDADACPVIDITMQIAAEYGIEVILVADFNHEFTVKDAQIIQVAQGADSSDHKIFSLTQKNDIVITSDGGLANLVLGKQAVPVSFSGFIYSLDNIDSVLMTRYLNAKARKAKHHFKNMAKRTEADDENYIAALVNVIEKNVSSS